MEYRYPFANFRLLSYLAVLPNGVAIDPCFLVQ